MCLMLVNKMDSIGSILRDFGKVDKQLCGYAQLLVLVKMKTNVIQKVPAREQQKSF